MYDSKHLFLAMIHFDSEGQINWLFASKIAMFYNSCSARGRYPGYALGIRFPIMSSRDAIKFIKGYIIFAVHLICQLKTMVFRLHFFVPLA